MNFVDLWTSIDEDKLNDAIGTLRLDFDLNAARECVYYACHRWLERDYQTFNVEGLEEKRVVDDFKYVVDMRGTFNGKGSIKLQEGRNVRLRSFEPLTGKRFILDWKTSKNALDQAWVDRYVDSWQWRHYLNKEKADIFIYRGIRRRNEVNGDIETKEFLIHSSEDPNLYESSDRQIKLLKSQRDSLITTNIVPWPMNRPNGCNKYGYECPYIGDCWAGMVPKDELDISHPVSYSRMEDFMLCPERYRRNAIAAKDPAGTGEDESDSASFGNAVHRGLHEVYRQIFFDDRGRKLLI